MSAANGRNHPGRAKRPAEEHEKRQPSTKLVFQCDSCELWKVRADFPGGDTLRCSACIEAELALIQSELGGDAERIDELQAEAVIAESKRLDELNAKQRKLVRLRKLAKSASRGKVARERSETAQERHHEATVEAHRLRREAYKSDDPDMDPAQKELLSRELSRRKVTEFALRFQPDYDVGWVHEVICAKLEKFSDDVVNRRSPRLMIQMPPRGGKSQLASDYFPSWHLGRNPTHEVICASYSESLPLEFSRNVRDRLSDPAYHSLFPKVSLHKSYQNATGWRTNASGGFVPVGVGGALTGRGAHVLIIDDPVKNAEEAESEAVREANFRWYQSTAYTRLAPGGGVLLIMTRWHDDDLAGRLERLMHDGDGDEFDIVRFPAIATQDEVFRKEGEALHPERFDAEHFKRIKKAVGPRTWSALYQQNPVPDEGGFVERRELRYYEELPTELFHYGIWDLAIGQKQHNDFTVGLDFGIDVEDNLYIVDVVRGRFGAFEIVEKMINMWMRHKQRDVGIEDGALKFSIDPLLQKRKSERNAYGMHILTLKPGKQDKVARARTIQGRIQQGKVFFPKEAPWLENMLHELLRFPYGVHDDCVDALAYAGIVAQKAAKPQKKSAAPGKSWLDRLGLPGRDGSGSFMSA